MNDFNENRKLLIEREKRLKELDALIKAKEKEMKEVEEVYAELIVENEKLVEILESCSVDVCPYRLAFEEMRDKYRNIILDHISNQRFHFFMCFRGNYYARLDDDRFREKTVVEYHQEVIDKKGYCWWAKFFRRRLPNGLYERLEPFGESISLDKSSDVAANIREKVKERHNNKESVYLFSYSPNPPDFELIVCNVTDFCFGKEKIPYENRLDQNPPQCAYFPDYYFDKKEGNCEHCKKYDPQRCTLRFPSNFWFRIDKIEKIKNVNKEFMNLENCFTKDFINLAIPIFYPLLVTQKHGTKYFQNMGVFTDIDISSTAKTDLRDSGMDERILRVLKTVDGKQDPVRGANIQPVKERRDENVWEYRFSKKGRIYVQYRKGQKPLIESIDFEHKHKG